MIPNKRKLEADEELDEELDEEPDEELDEEPDEEPDEEVDEELDEEVDEDGGPDVKKVLIMCQRKLSSIDRGVVRRTVRHIKNYINNLPHGVRHKIEYLTSIARHHEIPQSRMNTRNLKNKRRSVETSRYADHLILLDNDDENTVATAFVNRNKKAYDFIILNTCPVKLVSYEKINELLKDDGLLIIKAFTSKDAGGEKWFTEAGGNPNISNPKLANFFEQQQSPYHQTYGMYVYTKKTKKQSGGKRIKKTKRKLKRKQFKNTRKQFKNTRKQFKNTRKQFKNTRKQFKNTRKQFKNTRRRFKK
jgi:hypothetical protein